jgi:hypothetical protein
MKFLLLHYLDEKELDFAAKPDDRDPVERELQAWVTEMESTDVQQYGGRLRPTAETVTLRIRDGEHLLTDGYVSVGPDTSSRTPTSSALASSSCGSAYTRYAPARSSSSRP